MLRHQQNKSGLTEAELSAKYGFSQQAFNSWKTGVAPRPKMYPAIGAFLGINVDDVEMLAAEAKESYGTTKLPDMGAPVIGDGNRKRVSLSAFPFGYAKPRIDGTYAINVDGKKMWVAKSTPNADGQTAVIVSQSGHFARIATWPCALYEGETAHVVVLAEMA
ncbi:MAG: XRE family transcriptional regulator [Rhizobium sp.]|nr:XRE family transcriptional regulator [Rhizobium sp.]